MTYCLFLLLLNQLLDILLVIQLCYLTSSLVQLSYDFLLFIVELGCLSLKLLTLGLQLANLSLLKQLLLLVLLMSRAYSCQHLLVDLAELARNPILLEVSEHILKLRLADEPH